VYHLPSIYEKVIELGTKIISCPSKECSAVNKNLNEGVIPRVFFIEPFLSESSKGLKYEKAKITILGFNPGQILPFEAVAYREVLEKHNCLTKPYELECYERVFKEIHDIWVKCFGGWKLKEIKFPYFRNIKKLLCEISQYLERYQGIEEGDLILWAELVYCESKRRKATLPEKTVYDCVSKYLKSVLELSSDLIICIGQETFNYIGGKLLSEEGERFHGLKKALRDKVVLGFYHASGGGGANFYKYFEKEKKEFIKRRLKEPVKIKIESALRNRKSEFVCI